MTLVVIMGTKVSNHGEFGLIEGRKNGVKTRMVANEF